MSKPLACRVFGCRPRFSASGELLEWRCQRCGAGGEKRYPTAEQAERYARHLDREPREPVGLFAILSGTILRRGRRE